jgi:hypothetical protein
MLNYYVGGRLPAATPAAAATTGTAAATTTAAAGTTASTTVAGSAGRFGTSFIDVHGTAIQFGAIQLRDGGGRVTRLSHLDESESTGLPGISIRYDIYAFHIAVLSESGMQFFLSRLITQVPDKDVGHEILFLFSEFVFVQTAQGPKNWNREEGRPKACVSETDVLQRRPQYSIESGPDKRMVLLDPPPRPENR